MMANRNGFFYVLDRADRRVPARQAVREHDVGEGDWARTARRVLIPGQEPTEAGTVTCPDLVRRHELHVAVIRRVTGCSSSRCARRARGSSPRRRPPTRRSATADDRRHACARVGAVNASGALRALDPTTGERKWEITYDGRRLGRRARDRRRRRVQRRIMRASFSRPIRRPARSSSSSRPARRFSRRRPAT